MTEQEMQEAKVPTPKTAEELAEYIASLKDQQHDYGTCVYAMSMAATAAYNYMASQLGVTGFQASCADMDIIRRTRGIDRFMIVDANKFLYPQYDPVADLQNYKSRLAEWLHDEAQRLMDESGMVAPRVAAHWQGLIDAGARAKADASTGQ